MPLSLGPIGQIALATADVDRAETFYEKALRLRKLYRFGDLTFFDCAGVRLMIEKARSADDVARTSVMYFRCADIALAVRELEGRGVSFSSKPHLIAKMDDHDLWMAFFSDPDGHTLALMQEAPKGYTPPS
jgi:methylmalonyl-CoA/ethylmalonyl-CoA epimerase